MARLAEIERQEAEEEKKREEAKALKKQREREKIEQQKRDGTYLTKAQREEKLKNEMKLKQMVEAGAKVGGIAGGEKKKVVYDNKKKKGTRRNPEEIKVRAKPLFISLMFLHITLLLCSYILFDTISWF